MIWDVVKAAVNQPKERIGGQMLTYLRRNDGHGKPHHANIKSFKSGGIFASLFTRGQCSSASEYGAWRLGGNCCLLWASGLASDGELCLILHVACDLQRVSDHGGNHLESEALLAPCRSGSPGITSTFIRIQREKRMNTA